MNTKLVVMGVAVAMSLSAFCGIQISKVEASQRDKETGKVDITFDVTSPSNKVSVVLSAMNTVNNQTVAMNAIYDEDGNFLGNPAKIEPGKARHLVWNSALDLGKGFYSSSMIVTVRATEGYVIPNNYALLEKVKAQCAEMREPLVQAVNVARQGVVDAEAAAAEVTTEKLLAEVKSYEKQIEQYQRTIVECEAKAPILQAAYNEAVAASAIALANETNCAWTITYINASLDPVVVTGKGCATLVRASEELKFFTLEECTISLPDTTGWTTCYTWQDVAAAAQALNMATITTYKAAQDARDALTANTQVRILAQQGIIVAQDAIAKSPYNNRTTLQLNASIQVEKAKEKLEEAEKALEKLDKTCEWLEF